MENGCIGDPGGSFAAFHSKDWNTLAYHPDEIAEIYLGAKMTDEVKADFIALP